MPDCGVWAMGSLEWLDYTSRWGRRDETGETESRDWEAFIKGPS
jgi:hypothetical protein